MLSKFITWIHWYLMSIVEYWINVLLKFLKKMNYEAFLTQINGFKYLFHLSVSHYRTNLSGTPNYFTDYNSLGCTDHGYYFRFSWRRKIAWEIRNSRFCHFLTEERVKHGIKYWIFFLLLIVTMKTYAFDPLVISVFLFFCRKILFDMSGIPHFQPILCNLEQGSVKCQ